MSELNLHEWLVPELQTLAKDIEAEIKRRSEEDRKQVLVQMKELAAGVGMSLEDVLTYSSTKKPKGDPKYQNPDDPKQTWTGRGKRPSWIKAALEQGKSLDDLRI